VTIGRVETTTDLNAVRELFLEYAASLDVDLSYQDFSSEVAELPGDYAAPTGCLLLAMLATGPAGCVAVRAADAEIGEMKRLYVRPSARGSGLGRQLAESAIEFARAAGYRAMRLDTLPTMLAAQAIYRELGFREIPAYRFSPVPGNVYLELDLRAASPGR